VDFDGAAGAGGAAASAKRQRRSEAAAAARVAPQLSSHVEWSKHEHKMPKDALLKVRGNSCVLGKYQTLDAWHVCARAQPQEMVLLCRIDKWGGLLGATGGCRQPKCVAAAHRSPSLRRRRCQAGERSQYGHWGGRGSRGRQALEGRR